MAEVLSQSQIDELLNELSNEKKIETEVDLDEKTVKHYDFKSPKKMSRDQYKVLSSLTDVLARHIAAYFAGMLRNYCELELATIDEHPYFEYNNSLPDTLITAAIGIDSIDGIMLMDISNSITYTLIECMLGGNIESKIVPNREFTDIEVALMERIFKRICSFIQEVLSGIPNINVTLKNLETNTRFIREIRIEEVVEVVVYNINIGPVKGTITLCIPYNCVEAILSNIENHGEFSNEGVQSDEVKSSLLNELSDTYVDVCAILGEANLPMKDVINFQTGDVIKLNQKVDNPISITINKNKWFLGIPGVKKSYNAIKIKKYYKERP